MKSMKKVLLLVLAFIAFVGVTNVKAAEKVKVYIFEAGGCPYCEAEIEYLKGLSSYNEKFEIVTKELYVDHVDWAQGADYELGKTVAEAFLSAGFEQASYMGTPFVVISDLYAAAAYSENLENYINLAYEQGDKDVVSCYANGGNNCLEGADPNVVVPDTAKDDKKEVEVITTIVLLLIIAGSITLVVYTGKKNAEAESYDHYVKEKKEEKVENEVKKTSTTKKAPVKKATNKKKK